MERPVMRLSEVWKRLGLDRRTVYKMAESGELPTISMNGRFYVDRTKFASWCEGKGIVLEAS
jgi:excisionase family DNA binding protein